MTTQMRATFAKRLGAGRSERIGTVTSAVNALVNPQGLGGSAADCPSIFSHLPVPDATQTRTRFSPALDGAPRTVPAFLPPLRTAALLLLAFPLALLAQTSDATLNNYINATTTPAATDQPSPGSLFLGRSYLAEPARDPKAATVGDLITIQVVEQASALSSGTLSNSRAASNNHSVTNFFGGLNPAGALANLATSGGESSLDGARQHRPHHQRHHPHHRTSYQCHAQRKPHHRRRAGNRG